MRLVNGEEIELSTDFEGYHSHCGQFSITVTQEERATEGPWRWGKKGLTVDKTYYPGSAILSIAPVD